MRLEITRLNQMINFAKLTILAAYSSTMPVVSYKETFRPFKCVVDLFLCPLETTQLKRFFYGLT